MKILYFLSGFFFNLFMLLKDALPMSIDAGSVCVKNNMFYWEMDEMDFLDELEREAADENDKGPR